MEILYNLISVGIIKNLKSYIRIFHLKVTNV